MVWLNFPYFSPNTLVGAAVSVPSEQADKAIPETADSSSIQQKSSKKEKEQGFSLFSTTSDLNTYFKIAERFTPENLKEDTDFVRIVAQLIMAYNESDIEFGLGPNLEESVSSRKFNINEGLTNNLEIKIPIGLAYPQEGITKDLRRGKPKEYVTWNFAYLGDEQQNRQNLKVEKNRNFPNIVNNILIYNSVRNNPDLTKTDKNFIGNTELLLIRYLERHKKNLEQKKDIIIPANLVSEEKFRHDARFTYDSKTNIVSIREKDIGALELAHYIAKRLRLYSTLSIKESSSLNLGECNTESLLLLGLIYKSIVMETAKTIQEGKTSNNFSEIQKKTELDVPQGFKAPLEGVKLRDINSFDKKNLKDYKSLVFEIAKIIDFKGLFKSLELKEENINAFIYNLLSLANKNLEEKKIEDIIIPNILYGFIKSNVFLRINEKNDFMTEVKEIQKNFCADKEIYSDMYCSSPVDLAKYILTENIALLKDKNNNPIKKDHINSLSTEEDINAFMNELGEENFIFIIPDNIEIGIKASNKILDLTQQIQKLKKQIEDASKKIQLAKAKIENTEGNKVEIETQISKITASIGLITATIEAKQKKLAEDREEYEAELMEKNRENQPLREQLQQIQEELQQAQQEFASLKQKEQDLIARKQAIEYEKARQAELARARAEEAEREAKNKAVKK